MPDLAIASTGAAPGTRLHALAAVTVAGLAALMAVTTPLWWGGTDFPAVPLSGRLTGVPVAIDRLLWGGFLIGLLGAGAACLPFQGRGRTIPHGSENGPACVPAAGLFRTSVVVMLVCAVGLVSLDQHRFQPWFYHGLLVLIGIAWLPAPRARSLLRALAVSVYAWSALTKLHPDFSTTLGRTFLETLLLSIDQSTAHWSPRAVAVVPLVFPLGEALVALLLSFPRWRRWGVATALGLHALMLWILGPWGLQHHTGVLVWNVVFAAQTLCLHGPLVGREHRQPQPAAFAGGRRAALAAFVLGAALGLPAAYYVGLLDRWPAWGLYSPRTQRLVVLVRADAMPGLPASLQPHVAPANLLADWRPIRIDRWSLAVLKAPIYPEIRFEWGVAWALAARPGLADAIAVQLIAETRGRTEVSPPLTGLTALTRGARRFHLNAAPRRPFP